MNVPRVALTLMEVPIHDVTMEEAISYTRQWIAEKSGFYQVATVNPEFLMAARKHGAFRATLQKAALCVPDGIGVLAAARLRGTHLRERVAGSDLVPRLAAEAARCGWRVFFLGAAPGIAERAADILATRYPGLQIAGCYAGSPALVEEDAIVARVRATQTDLLLVAYGAPKQDLWLARNLHRTGATVGIGVGGSFDFIAGLTRRAPRWIQRVGLEWLYRLLQEPRRWRRQLALPHFAVLILLGRDAPLSS
ncbi:MAG: WecB/TagA/CpsF family glycosyltransferase [Anaerolineae bacterium]|nr:WecB/TagA/CpsF family glycosyltransferase [Anaerolineae bacterium]